jgi:hypothetical protein
MALNINGKNQKSDSVVNNQIPLQNICYINGIKIVTVRTCTEIESFYGNVFCPAWVKLWEDSNCEDFNTQEDAQSEYETSIKCTRYDVSDLDRDKDGVACEELSEK